MGYFIFFLLTVLSYGANFPYEQTSPSSAHNQRTETQQHDRVESTKIKELSASTPKETTDETFSVVRAIDGDTIEVLIGGEKKTVRYIGINTPETVHPSKPAECFGKEASDKNKMLVEGQSVRLEKDISETDKYGRLLRYVYVGETMINEALVEGGYAHASTYPPDVKYTDVFLAAEKTARETERGLWGSACEDHAPASEKISTAPVSAQTPISATQGQCTIKGNINSEDEKIYHMIGCQSYAKTVIDESTGEQWFCTEKEALDAGWRKALNC